MGPFFEILVLFKYSSLCWMCGFLVEFLVDHRKILHLSFRGKRSGRGWERRRRLGLLCSSLVWWRFFFVFAGWWNLEWLRLWRDLRKSHRLKYRSPLMVSTNSLVIRVELERPALESSSWSLRSLSGVYLAFWYWKIPYSCLLWKTWRSSLGVTL